MTLKSIFKLLVACFAIAAPVANAAEGEGMVWSGEVGIGARGQSANALDPSKSREYRDLHSAPLGSFDLKGRGDEYYLNAFGENLGRDDMFLDLRGGKYGMFKYQLYDNEMRHNFGSGVGALSPFSGIGGTNLTAPLSNTAGFTNTNPANWNGFDNSYTRKDYGGMFEFTNNSPWYIRFEGNEVKRQGIKVLGAANGTSPGQGFVDLPSPVDFKTTNFSVEGGYTGKRGHVAANFQQSRFTNANPFLNFSSPYLQTGTAVLGVQDTALLPPSNDLTKFGVNGNLRQLPGNSTLAGRLTYSKLTDEVGVLQNILSNTNVGAGTPVNASTAASTSLYQGNVANKSASLSLTSHPFQAVDTRVYWNWARKDNNSSTVTFSPLVANGLSGGSGTVCSSTAPCTNELFNYRKANGGFEGGYRFNPENKVAMGFDYYDTLRERPDVTHTIERKYFIEGKNSSFEMLDTRLKYQYLQRRSNYLGGDLLNLVDQYVRRYDLANSNQQLVKLVFDFSPRQFVDIGLEGIYKHNDYHETPLGRQRDDRQEYYASVSLGDPQSFRMMVFGDMELVQYDSRHRVGTGNPDPNAPPSGTTGAGTATYTWTAKNLDRSYQVGVGADWLPAERWVFKGSLAWAKTQGTADFSALANVSAAGTGQLVASLLPIQNFDNTTKATLNLKGTYKYTKNWDFTGGYAYERYRFSDIGYDNYAYTVGAAASATCTGGGNRCAAYLSGQSAYQNYNASILYLFGTYKF